MKFPLVLSNFPWLNSNPFSTNFRFCNQHLINYKHFMTDFQTQLVALFELAFWHSHEILCIQNHILHNPYYRWILITSSEELVISGKKQPVIFTESVYDAADQNSNVENVLKKSSIGKCNINHNYDYEIYDSNYDIKYFWRRSENGMHDGKCIKNGHQKRLKFEKRA